MVLVESVEVIGGPWRVGFVPFAVLWKVESMEGSLGLHMSLSLLMVGQRMAGGSLP